jgi:esterase/lipase superfamily enzyme
MRYEHHRWFSQRLGREMGIAVYGHYGSPFLVFPTSGGDEHEYAGQGMIEAISGFIEDGRVKFYCINSVNNQSWHDEQAHPRHKSYVQAMYDDYVAREVAPFIHDDCATPGIPITTTGASFGAYHAVNSLLKHPDLFRRCIAQSGVYDLRRFMGGDYDENFYFNNPVDYVASLSDAWFLGQLAGCDIRLVTGNGPWEDCRPTYQLSGVLWSRGIAHSVDDWGPEGGHEWPYWKRQMIEYLSRLY